MSNVKSVLLFGVGFVGGWAARSLADSPQGVGVKLLEIGLNAKDKVGRWARLEGERLEDMLAEARARIELEPADPDETTNGAAHPARTTSGET